MDFNCQTMLNLIVLLLFPWQHLNLLCHLSCHVVNMDGFHHRQLLIAKHSFVGWLIHQQLFYHFYELRVWSLWHINPKLSLFYLGNSVVPIINIYCQLWPINDVQIKWHYIIQSIINQTKLRNVVMLMFTILYLVVLLSLIKIIIEIFAEIVFCGECSPITFSMYVASIETKSCQKHTSSLYKHDLIDISCWHCLIIKIMVPRAVYIQNQKFITKLGLRSDGPNINEHSTTWVDSPHRKAPLTWRRVNSVDQKLFAGFHTLRNLN